MPSFAHLRAAAVSGTCAVGYSVVYVTGRTYHSKFSLVLIDYVLSRHLFMMIICPLIFFASCGWLTLSYMRILVFGDTYYQA